MINKINLQLMFGPSYISFGQIEYSLSMIKL